MTLILVVSHDVLIDVLFVTAPGVEAVFESHPER